MNDNSNFTNTLNMMWDLQVPIITVEMLDEEFYDKWVYADHIIIPDGKDKVTDFMFVRHRTKNTEYDFLARVTSLDMGFEDAIVEFSKKTLRCQGARLKLHAN